MEGIKKINWTEKEKEFVRRALVFNCHEYEIHEGLNMNLIKATKIILADQLVPKIALGNLG